MSDSTRARPQVILLVDDDSLIQMTWKIYCRRQGVSFYGFAAVEQATQSETVRALPRGEQTWVVVDSELGDGLARGEESSRVFAEMGFEKIWISTGHPPEEIQAPAWVVGVRGKEPWF